MKCIDPWLTKNRRVCPVCKGKVVLPGMADPTDSESEAENAVTERTPLVTNVRQSRWRRTRHDLRAPVVSVVDTPSQEAHLPLGSGPATDGHEGFSAPATGVSFPVTSGHFSVNCEEGETGGVDVRESSTSSTVAVVEVEPVHNPVTSSAPASTRRTSRRNRRNDAIV